MFHVFPFQELITEKITQLLQHCYNFEIAEYFGTLVLSKRENVEQMVNEYLNSDQPYLQITALTAIGRSRIDRKLNSPFTDSYILNIDRNKFADINVQKVYDRVSICLRE